MRKAVLLLTHINTWHARAIVPGRGNSLKIVHEVFNEIDGDYGKKKEKNIRREETKKERGRKKESPSERKEKGEERKKVKGEGRKREKASVEKRRGQTGRGRGEGKERKGFHVDKLCMESSNFLYHSEALFLTFHIVPSSYYICPSCNESAARHICFGSTHIVMHPPER